MLFIQYVVLSNYADDNDLFSIGENKDDIKSLILLNLEYINPGKSRYMCLGENVDNKKVFKFNGLSIKSSKKGKMLDRH